MSIKKTSLQILQETRRELHDTVNTAVSVQEELKRQGEKINKTQEKINDVKVEISHSSKIINRMKKWYNNLF